jgi:hypothetical protein
MSNGKKSKHQQHQHTAAPKENRPKKENTNRHVYVEPGVQIDLVDSLKNEFKAEQHESNTRQNSQLLWTKIGAILLFVYTIITGLMYCANKKAADAAKNAADTAHDTLIASQRPWVGIAKDSFRINGVNISPDVAEGHEGRVVVSSSASVVLENSGNTPAVRVSPFTLVAFFTDEDIPPENWKTVSCQAAGENISYESKQTYFIMPKSTIQTGGASIQGTAQSVANRHFFWLIGCIVYRDSLQSGTHHTVILMHSGFSAQIPYSPAGLSTYASEAN